MKLKKIIGNTYYLENRTNIGIYKTSTNDVYIIDTGNAPEVGKKILKIITNEGWHIKGIINTHSHADHTGGNKYISSSTNAPVYSKGIETCFINYPKLEPAYLYGANPLFELHNKFLESEASQAKELPEISGLEIINLKGHSFDMIGIKTSDNVYFLGDALISAETINKYHIFFLYDVKEYLNTLDFLSTLKGKFYLPSHTPLIEDLTPLIKLNRSKIEEIVNNILIILKTPTTFEELLTSLFNIYDLKMDINQYVLVGCTIKAYLSYLYNENKIIYTIDNNKLIWQKVN